MNDPFEPPAGKGVGRLPQKLVFVLFNFVGSFLGEDGSSTLSNRLDLAAVDRS